MAFDGLTIHVLLKELSKELLGGRIDKIYQVEKDEILLNIRSVGQMKHLLLSASASHARLQLTEKHYETPLNPPMFCMLLRKHLGNGKIVGFEQPRHDRIAAIHIETMNDLGDLVVKTLMLEMMGKHSNLMLVDEEGKITDAIRHVSARMSSVRTVMPGLSYELPSHNSKTEPLVDKDVFLAAMERSHGPIETALYQTFFGFSPFTSREVLYRSAVEGKKPYEELTKEEKERLYEGFSGLVDELDHGPYRIRIYRDKAGKNVDFSAVPIHMLEDEAIEAVSFDSLSALMDVYFEKTDTVDKMRQKTQETRHLLNTNLERVNKKLHLQKKQLLDTKDRDKDRLYGDLITANLYQLKEGMSRAELVNYYEESMPQVVVKLEANLTPAQNAQKYYARYNKMKRTEEALTGQIRMGEEEKVYLESLISAVGLADCEQDLEDIREEMRQTGYLKKVSQKTRQKKNLASSKPLSFVTSEGVKGLIGKNNLQNDQLTFKTALPKDEWFHVKDIPGSHVILLVRDLVFGKDYTEKSWLEAAAQAAIHSQAAGNEEARNDSAAAITVAVDHTKRMYVKKPAGSKPGFVIYTHQETIFVKV